MVLDPNAVVYTDDQIVGKVNSASAQITRAGSVAAAARPIGNLEIAEGNIAANAVTNAKLASAAAKDNLDALGDTARGYIKTGPTSGEFKVVSIQRDVNGKLDIDYDNVAV
jgi:hypothetical protein